MFRYRCWRRASELDGVTTVHSIMPPQFLQGAIVSEGVSVHRVAPWHQSGFRGRGVKIGIIDGGFKGFQALMGTELPSAVSVRCYNGIGEFTTNFEDCGSGISHGTAVTEAVFDIAPEATYYVTTVRGYNDLREAVEWMVSEDVDIINHSLGWPWLGPGDGTSPFRNSPLKSVDVAVDGGMVWVGPQATRRWRPGLGNSTTLTEMGCTTTPAPTSAIGCRSHQRATSGYSSAGTTAGRERPRTSIST